MVRPCVARVFVELAVSGLASIEPMAGCHGGVFGGKQPTSNIAISAGTQRPPYPAPCAAAPREEELETKRWLRQIAIVGSPETVSARIAALKDELGFGNFMLVTGFLGNLGQGHVVKTLELFAKGVMPHFERPQ